MKRCQMFFVTLCGIAMLSAASANAAVPQTISYQGRLTDAAGDPVPDVPIRVKFIIYRDAVGGAILWNSGTQVVTPTDGLFTYPLGSNVVLPDNLFTDTIRYLGITVDVDPELTPRERFRTVPYAYQALRADTADISVTVFDGAITSVKLAANSVKSVHIVDGTITSTDISNSTITATDMAANSVGAAQIQSNAVNNSKMTNNSIGSAEVIDNSLTASDLAAGSVTGSEIATDAVNNSKMTNNSIGSAEVIDNSLTAADLAANSVGVSEIAVNAVNNSKMTNNAIGSAEVIDNSLTAADLAAGSVGASELATGSVVGGFGGDILDNTITSADLAAGSVGLSEIGPNAIISSRVVNGSLFDIDLGDEPGVAQSVSSTGINLTGPVQVLLSRSLIAPTNGFVLAIATFEVSIFHTSGTFSAADFGVSTSSTTFPFAGSRRWGISNLLANGTREVVITVSRMFSVGLGPTTFFFLGDKASGANNHNVDDMSLSLAFFPTLYGGFSLEPPSPPGNSEQDERLHETPDGQPVKPVDK
ncbi:MAG: hypothetical protein IH914_01940 [candidate division Zixibacteria bacterium]|nr:hypothetical protein [candidate division Zixibacteria bacterium]